MAQELWTPTGLSVLAQTPSAGMRKQVGRTAGVNGEYHEVLLNIT